MSWKDTRNTFHHGNSLTAMMIEARAMVEAGQEPSIRKIAKRVGVSPTCVYRYVASKRVLMERVTAGITPTDRLLWAQKCLVATGLMSSKQAEEIMLCK